MTGVKVLGIPVQTVIGKVAYLAGVLVAWAITATILSKVLGPILLRAGGSAGFYAVVVTTAQLFVAVFFLVWLRNVRNSEGGRVAALGLAILLGLSLAAIAVIFWIA